MTDSLGPYLLGPNDTAENGIYAGDALECLAGIPDRSIDALITDPPYCAGAISEAQRTRAKGQGLRSENIQRFGWFVGDNMGTQGLSWAMRHLAIMAAQRVRPSGSVLVFCDWRMMPALEPAIESGGLRYQNLVVWNKGSMGLGTGFRNQHELIMHFTLGAPEYHDKSIANVVAAKRVSISERCHQAEKPVDLLAQLVQVVAPPGGIVVDPFAGSCSIAVACKMLGRKYLCFEIDPDTTDLARERVRNTQPPLFIPGHEQLNLELP